MNTSSTTSKTIDAVTVQADPPVSASAWNWSGSAANSAVCYALGITEVDPARMSMLFERFISKERNEPPDIDVDFEHQRREEVMQYVYAKYGRDRAALAATLITYRPKSAVRDVGKALGLSLAEVDRLAGVFAWWDGRAIHAERIREEALILEDAGCFAVVLEMIPHLNLAPVGALNLQGLLSDEHYSSLWGFARTTKNNLFAFSCICTFNPCDSEKVSKLTVFLIKISSTSILFD